MEFASTVENHDAVVTQAVDTLRQMDLSDPATSLPTFFCRPIRIATVVWNVGDFLRETYDPWTLLIQDAALNRKLSNYTYLRAKLRVRATINGNGFYYGKALVSYNPLGLGQRDPLRTPGNAPTVDNVRYSQRPHIVLDPCESRGGDLELPFVNYFTYAGITSSSGGNEAIGRMGSITLSSFNPLAHANGSSTPVTITLFAWFEDAEAVAPTASLANTPTTSNLTTRQQISEGSMSLTEPIEKPVVLFSDASDEYGEGVVSRPASAVARAAGALKSVPYIGRYAVATETGANMVGNIAKMFGYCRPNSVAPVDSFRPQVFGNLCNTSLTDAAQKLSFDPKQEVSIDPGTTGYGGQDDMTINAISSTESYYTRFEWSRTMPSDQLLFHTAVNPGCISLLTTGILTEFHTTPQHHASAPFQYWRGSMTYRFSVACSNFHRGRLRIVYDPVVVSSGSPPEFSTNYQRIVDISEAKDFEITIPWNQGPAFRYTQTYNEESPQLLYSPSPDTDADFQLRTILSDNESNNGYLSIYVLNELTVPNDTDSDNPEINCFLRAGDDFELACPTSRGIENFSFFPVPNDPSSVVELPSLLDSSVPLESVPELFSDSGRGEAQAHDEVLVLDSPGKVQMLDSTNLVYFGETLTSFRELLKRYQFLDIFVDKGAAYEKKYMWRLRLPNFPLYRGWDDSGLDLKDSQPYTFAKMTLMNWLTPSYVSRKGGIRWKYHMLNEDQYPTHSYLSVMRHVSDYNFSYPVNQRVDLTNDGTFDKEAFVNNLPTGWAGMAATATMINPTVEFELPYYSNHRFKPGAGVSLINFLDEMHETNIVGPAPTGSFGNGVSRYVAAGEDFSLDWYLNAPVIYFDQVV